MERLKHPRPDMTRKNFLSLDGEWKYCVGDSDVPAYYINNEFEQTVIVPDPRCFNDANFLDNCNDVWYKRTFHVNEFQRQGRVFINFLGVGESANIYINGTPCMAHIGEKSNFCFEISQVLLDGPNQIAVNVFRTKKNSQQNDSSKVFGLWRSVWLEFCSNSFLAEINAVTAQDGSSIFVGGIAVGIKDSYAINIVVSNENKTLASYRYIARDNFMLSIPLKNQIVPWAPNNPKIYDLEISLLNEMGEIIDLIYTYFSYRPIRIIGNQLFISGQKTLIRGVRVDNAILSSEYDNKCKQIRRILATALSMGFNTIVLPYYCIDPILRSYADRLGIMILEEFNQDPTIIEDKQLTEEIAKDISILVSKEARSPSIIMRSIFSNYQGGGVLSDYMYRVAKNSDPYTIITSGGGLIYSTDIIEYQGPCDSAKNYIELLMSSGFHFKNEKAENKFRQLNPTLARVEKIAQIPKLLSNFSCGIVPAHDVMGEYDFIKKYSNTVMAINKFGILGWIYDRLYDNDKSCTGFFKSDGMPKLSRLASDTIKRLNLKQ
ncbi:MAG: hypothetical protein LBF68_05745 [Christensenellaceae bacterium]|jgi:beta-galactosidase/beta-glucuronidase|nr:hypothetical protein [Christensenellaceae bacterium]